MNKVEIQINADYDNEHDILKKLYRIEKCVKILTFFYLLTIITDITLHFLNGYYQEIDQKAHKILD